MSLGKRKLKGDTCTFLELPQSGAVTESNAGEDAEQQELSLIAGGNAKWHSRFGRQFGGFFQN